MKGFRGAFVDAEPCPRSAVEVRTQGRGVERFMPASQGRPMMPARTSPVPALASALVPDVTTRIVPVGSATSSLDLSTARHSRSPWQVHEPR